MNEDPPKGGAEFQNLVFVSLGSNLGNSRQIILDALQQLRGLSETPLLVSSLWQTSPVDCPPGSPNFVNAVLGFAPRSTESPESLLPKLQSVEREFGRLPKRTLNEPRPLDLDIISFGREIRNSPQLILPHPRAVQRKFVLQPLCEIAPLLVFPGYSQTISDLLSQIDSDEQIIRLH